MTRRDVVGAAEPEVNLTSFMNIILFILAFFVATFNPPMPGRNFDVSSLLPKDAPHADFECCMQEPAVMEDVTITLAASPDGTLASIRLEDKPIGNNVGALCQELHRVSSAIRGATGEKLETANIVVPRGLKFRYVIAAVYVCWQNQFKRINFSEAPVAAP